MAKKKTHDEFVKEVYSLVADEYEVVGKYVNAYTKIVIKHKLCGNTYFVAPTDFLSGKRCPFCCHNPQKVAVGFNSMWDTNPGLAKLLLNPDDGYKYTQSSNKKADWKCPNCGEVIKDKCINDVNQYGLSCRKCGDGVSYPSKILYSMLSQLGIDFIAEKSFDWCKYEFKGEIKKGYYDFYFNLNEQEYIIEVDGGFHSQTNRMNGRTREESDYIDNQKDKLADEHNIKVIRIDCYESNINYIKDSIINSDLKLIFNLSKIDWDECHKYGLSSEVINSCNLYKQNYSVIEIAKMLHKNRATIVRYLKTGAEIGYCDYDSMEAWRKSAEYSRQFLKKPVICLETKNIYESTESAKRECNASNIIRSCRDRRLYAGMLKDGTRLHWMYYDEYLKYKNDHNNEEPVTYNQNPNNIPIIQYDLQGVFVSMFMSIKDASETTHINESSITHNCRGKYKTAGGYIWRYATPEEILLYQSEVKNN